MSFYEWDRLPYGCRHWTSCTTPGDKCLGDCPILAPPVLWKLCSVYEMVFKGPSRCYFWVYTKRKITVKKNLLASGSVAQFPRSFPQRNSSPLYSCSLKWQAATHISSFPAWAYTILLMTRIYFIIYICFPDHTEEITGLLPYHHQLYRKTPHGISQMLLQHQAMQYEFSLGSFPQFSLCSR